MPLDDLVSVIETLQRRIRDHGDTLRQNEYRTRMALIDPLLTALGWDVADPGLVMPEYDVSGRKADYAFLKSDRQPAATLEAKKLGESLDSHRMQMLNYSNASGVEYSGLTDGNRWELYEVFRRGQLEDRRILDVTLSTEPSYQCALKFLLLWRPNLASGEPVASSEPLLANGQPADSSVTNLITDSEPIVVSTTSVEEGEGWVSFLDLGPVTRRKPPSALRLPNGEVKEITFWWNVLFEVLEWQIRAGKLTSNECPVKSGQTRYIVHTSPQHSNGTDFNHFRKLSNGLVMDTPYDAQSLVNNAKRLLTHFQDDLGSVWLRTD